MEWLIGWIEHSEGEQEALGVDRFTALIVPKRTKIPYSECVNISIVCSLNGENLWGLGMNTHGIFSSFQILYFVYWLGGKVYHQISIVIPSSFGVVGNSLVVLKSLKLVRRIATILRKKPEVFEYM